MSSPGPTFGSIANQLKDLQKEIDSLKKNQKIKDVRRLARRVRKLLRAKWKAFGLFPKVSGVRFLELYVYLSNMDNLLRASKFYQGKHQSEYVLSRLSWTKFHKEKLMEFGPEVLGQEAIDILAELNREIDSLMEALAGGALKPGEVVDRLDALEQAKTRAISTMPAILGARFPAVYWYLAALDVTLEYVRTLLERVRSELASGKQLGWKIDVSPTLSEIEALLGQAQEAAAGLQDILPQ